MFCASRNHYFASTGADIDLVMESPTIETNLTKGESAVNGNQESNKRRVQFVEGQAAEQGPSKRQQSSPFCFSHSSLASDVNIYDSDGLFIVPDEGIADPARGQYDIKTSYSVPLNQELQQFHSLYEEQHNNQDLLVNAEIAPTMSDLQLNLHPEVRAAPAPPTPPAPPAAEQTPIVNTSTVENPLESLVANIVRNLGTISQLVTTSPTAQPQLFAQLNSASELVQNLLSTITSSTSPEGTTSSPPEAIPPQLSPTMSVPLAQPSPSSSSAPTISIRLLNTLETIWYADRPYPQFDCELYNVTSLETVKPTTECSIRVVLLDGEDNVVDKLTGQAASFNFEFPVSDGCSTISGLRFAAVSSKHGGYFRLRFEILCHELQHTAAPFVSDKIQVLSYRLFHARKLDFSKLKRTDSINKVKGIGSLYAKRFAEIGIETIEQLAGLDVDSLQNGGRESKKLLETLRKDRGALTLAKLNEYISQAREIVQRGDRSESD